MCLYLGGNTPGPLTDYLREAFGGNRDDGFIQRFQLAVYPNNPSAWRNVDRFPDSAARSQAFDIFARLAALPTAASGDIPTLRFDPAAQAFFNDWHGILENRLRDSEESPIMVTHLAKYRKLLPSLALLLELCSHVDHGPVRLDAVELAAAWCTYLEAHARRLYHNVTGRGDLAVRLLGSKIKTQKLGEAFTARDVYTKHWTGLRNPAEVEDALAALEDLGWLKGQTIPTGGRTTRRWYVHPEILDGRSF